MRELVAEQLVYAPGPRVSRRRLPKLAGQTVGNSQDQPTAQIVEALRTVLSQVAEPNAVLAAILRQAVVGTGADRGLVAQVLNDGAMEYQVMHGFKADQFEGDAGAFSRNLFRRVVESGEEVLLERAADDPFFGTIRSVRALSTAAILCMPIRTGRGIAAVVHLESRRAGHFKAEHRELLRSLLTVAGPVVETLQVGRQVLMERDAFRQEAEESRALLSVRKAATKEFPVLLLGETGTGKGLLARVLHSSGPREKRPFVTVFCPSLEKGMVEAELFGVRKGAFTGALADRAGKVHAADGGTLFLDEIGELGLEIQSKLLRLLQDRAYERVGDPQEQKADVRIIAATNRDLELEVERGRFRRDLFDRLNFLPIRVPSLRERLEDIPLLLRYCLDRTESGRWIEVPAEVPAFLQQIESLWPGNVRHIEQLAARLVVEGGSGPVSVRDVERLLDKGGARADGSGANRGEAPATDSGLADHMEEAERSFLQEFIRGHSRLTRAEQARKLKIGEATLFKKLRQYGIGE
jgi:Nif-specific regulatory protein